MSTHCARGGADTILGTMNALLEVHRTDSLTGKPMHTLVMGISRFAGGKIAEEWQLGVPAAEA
jgi:hypothetical protein